MAPSKKKGGSKAAAFKQFRLGDLVLAKVKGFPAWPAKISRPEEWHQPHDPKKVFVYFYGTEEIGYCVPSDVQIFSVDLRNKILAKCRGKASSDFIRAVEQICAEFDDSMRGRQEKSPKTDNDKPHMGFDIAKESNEKLQLPETFVSDSISKCQKSQSVKHDISKEKKEKQLLKPEFTQDNQRDKMDESVSSAKRDLSMTNETNVGDVTPTRWRSAKADHNKPMSKPQKRIGVFEEDKSQGMVTEPQMKRMKRDIKGSSEMRGHCLDDYNTSQNVTNENEQHDINTSSVELVSKHNDKFAQPFQEDARLFKEIKVTSELVDDKELQQSIANNNTTDSETIRSKSLQQSITNNITTDSEAVRSNSLGEKLQVLDTDPNAQENLPDDKQGAFVGDDKDASSNEDKPIEEKRNPNCFLRHNPITKRKRKSSKKHTPDAVLQDMPGDSDQKKSNISPQENAFRVFPGTDYRKKRTQLKARKERPNMDEGPSSSIQFKERSQRLSLETSPSEAQQNTRKPRPEMPQGPHTGAHIKEKKQGSNLDDRLPKGPKMKARKSSSGVLEVTSSRAQLKSRKQKSDLPDGSLPSIQPKTQRPDSDEFLPLPKKKRLDSSADGTSETNMLVKNDVMSCEMHLKVNDSSNLNRTATDKTFLNIDKSSPPVEKNSLLPPKADKYCLRCNLPGDETALPPSKRRYRAQEAMSACVAEAASASEGQEVTGIPVTDNTTGSCESSKMVAENVVSCNLNYDSFIGRDTRQMPDDENKNSYTKESMEQTSIQHDTSEHAQKRMDNSLISSPKKQVKSGLYFQHCDSVSLSPNKLIIAERNASEQNENKAKGSKLKKPVISLKKNVGTAKNQLIDTEKPSQEHIPNHLSGSLFSSKKVIASSNPKTKLNGLKSEELISPHVEKGNNIKPIRLDVAKKSRDISKIDEGEPTKSLKHLLAAAQARRREQVRSAALTNPPGKEEPETLIPSFISSPSPTHQSSSPQSSPSQFNPVHMVPEDTKANFTCGMQKVPGANIHSLNTYGAEYAIQEETNGGTFNGDTEAAVARDAFEGMLETLSRTKESIGRASRHAIDCAKYGMASEIIELLIQRLETESSFHRRIDLFFLVDSITQCSHSQKGIASASYIPVVQAALPRILSAAAPRGSVARENRRQCLKVLRLWLERKILPESVLRKYMSEFGSINDERHSNFLSRRPARSERAVDDPVREIEGMLDEYGSNATFQLPGFLMQNIFDDEETPESDTKKLGVDLHADAPRSQEEPIKSPGEPVYKHRHILEDVDGELEMEDASPSQVYDTSSQQNASGERGFSQTVDPHGSFPPLPPSSPPLPCETPPSPPPSPPPPPPPPPPLPESPPPPPPSSPPPPLPSSSPFGCPPSLSQPYTKAVNDSNFHMLPGNVQQQSNHVVVPGASHNPHVVQQMQSNNANMSFAQQSYCPPPPTLPPSTQFSFVRPEIQHPMQQVWMDCSPIHDQEMTSIHEDRWRLVNNERGRWMQDQLSTQRAAAPGIFWPSGTAPYPPMMQHPAQKPIVPSGSIHPTMGNIGGAPANHLVSQTNPARPGLSAMNSWRHG